MPSRHPVFVCMSVRGAGREAIIVKTSDFSLPAARNHFLSIIGRKKLALAVSILQAKNPERIKLMCDAHPAPNIWLVIALEYFASFYGVPEIPTTTFRISRESKSTR